MCKPAILMRDRGSAHQFRQSSTASSKLCSGARRKSTACGITRQAAAAAGTACMAITDVIYHGTVCHTAVAMALCGDAGVIAADWHRTASLQLSGACSWHQHGGVCGLGDAVCDAPQRLATAYAHGTWPYIIWGAASGGQQTPQSAIKF